MPSKALLEQAKHDFFRFWIKTSIVCGIKPPHHLTSSIYDLFHISLHSLVHSSREHLNPQMTNNVTNICSRFIKLSWLERHIGIVRSWVQTSLKS